ncbi:MAG: hypothetical protein AB1424_13025 [Thermodesulfobacteriota bacterium]
MCRNERRYCCCGRNSAFLLFRDNLLYPEILINLYCPLCQDRAVGDEAAMLRDCGWILEYDIPGAQALLQQQGVKGTATPEFLFDEGYLSWQGLSPGDQEMNAALHRRLAPLIEQDLARYLESMKSEWLKHVAELKAAGWRKAQKA